MSIDVQLERKCSLHLIGVFGTALDPDGGKITCSISVFSVGPIDWIRAACVLVTSLSISPWSDTGVGN